MNDFVFDGAPAVVFILTAHASPTPYRTTKTTFASITGNRFIPHEDGGTDGASLVKKDENLSMLIGHY